MRSHERQRAFLVPAAESPASPSILCWAEDRRRAMQQLHIECFSERFHLQTAKFAVDDASQKPDDSPPFVVLSTNAENDAQCLIVACRLKSSLLADVVRHTNV